MKFSRAFSRTTSAIAVAALVSSCAGVPRTDDTINVSPTLIAAAIRCEMRDAFANGIVSAIARKTDADGRPLNVETVESLDRDRLAAYLPAGLTPNDDQRREIPAKHEADVWGEFLKSGYKHMTVPDSEVEALVETFSPTFIAYRFKFDITQTVT